MRYTVHTHRTFHHRITKYLGVLVGAALVATLGLPSAVQAQTPAAPTVTGTGDGTVGSNGTLTVMWGQPLGTGFRTGSVAGRIYRAWRRMGQGDGDSDRRTAPL